LPNLECDVEFWLDRTQLSEDGKESYDSRDAVTHRSTMNELTNHLNTQQSADDDQQQPGIDK